MLSCIIVSLLSDWALMKRCEIIEIESVNYGATKE